MKLSDLIFFSAEMEIAGAILDIKDYPISSSKTRSKPALFDVFRVIFSYFSSFFPHFL
jgi:hypothetical protein